MHTGARELQQDDGLAPRWLDLSIRRVDSAVGAECDVLGPHANVVAAPGRGGERPRGNRLIGGEPRRGPRATLAGRS